MKTQKLFLTSAIASALLLNACGGGGGDHKTNTKDNTSPVSNNISFATQADTDLKAKLVATDADNDPLTFTVVSQPMQGTLVLNADGSFVYTPKPDTVGDDQFTFMASDGKATTSTYTASITVNKLDVAFDEYLRKAYAQAASAAPLPLDTRNINQNVTDPTAFDDLLK